MLLRVAVDNINAVVLLVGLLGFSLGLDSCC